MVCQPEGTPCWWEWIGLASRVWRGWWLTCAATTASRLSWDNYERFHEDLKKMYRMAGVKNEDPVFFFTDTHTGTTMVMDKNVLWNEEEWVFEICSFCIHAYYHAYGLLELTVFSYLSKAISIQSVLTWITDTCDSDLVHTHQPTYMKLSPIREAIHSTYCLQCKMTCYWGLQS